MTMQRFLFLCLLKSSLPEVRSSRPEVVLCTFALQLYWNRKWAWVFSCKFAAYFQSTFFKEHLWVAASERCSVKDMFLKIQQNAQENKYLNFAPDVFGEIGKQLHKKVRFNSKIYGVIHCETNYNTGIAQYLKKLRQSSNDICLEYKLRNIFLQKWCKKEARRLVSD